MVCLRSSSGILRENLLGVGVSAINLVTALWEIEQWIQRREPHYVCTTGVHGVMEAWRNREVRWALNRASLVTPDGMPLVWFLHYKGYSQVSRVYGPDLLLAVCERSVITGWAHYFYGGAEGVPEKLVQNLQKWFPGLRVAGMESPPFRPLSEIEDAVVMRRINESKADILWVGLGTPKQDLWMAAHFRKITVPVMIGVGAAFDFHAGVKPQAPFWMQRSGLEWLFRLLREPRRLWKRYFSIVPSFTILVLLQILGILKKDLEDEIEFERV
jgi:N-acetylglucosaminyldiphosphoundecaprenol N-acetyl-beta-D-mannosaminyltransferase